MAGSRSCLACPCAGSPSALMRSRTVAAGLRGLPDLAGRFWGGSMPPGRLIGMTGRACLLFVVSGRVKLLMAIRLVLYGLSS